jgi:hypothetical protein
MVSLWAANLGKRVLFDTTGQAVGGFCQLELAKQLYAGRI